MVKYCSFIDWYFNLKRINHLSYCLKYAIIFSYYLDDVVL
jgi:hypothetical protein